jgi:two-component system chemotaxis response regulator CheY
MTEHTVNDRAEGRVLVVDDSAAVRAYHRAILAEAGFGVQEAVNGYEGLEFTLAEPFALLVVDVNMPVMDGYALVEAVRSQAVFPDVPIIMISTEGEAIDAEQAYRRGANLYLVKPVAAESLVLNARMLTGQVHGSLRQTVPDGGGGEA